mmetsp:Transcript_7681/g.21555  ORF Transcript_7681/g.21555 Transcript_7681/m.21555 type:complete len:211 (-) Transcript_7681:222-854(-)
MEPTSSRPLARAPRYASAAFWPMTTWQSCSIHSLSSISCSSAEITFAVTASSRAATVIGATWSGARRAIGAVVDGATKAWTAGATSRSAAVLMAAKWSSCSCLLACLLAYLLLAKLLATCLLAVRRGRSFFKQRGRLCARFDVCWGVSGSTGRRSGAAGRWFSLGLSERAVLPAPHQSREEQLAFSNFGVRSCSRNRIDRRSDCLSKAAS